MMLRSAEANPHIFTPLRLETEVSVRIVPSTHDLTDASGEPDACGLVPLQKRWHLPKRPLPGDPFNTAPGERPDFKAFLN
jgi:hypothetical protein